VLAASAQPARDSPPDGPVAPRWPLPTRHSGVSRCASAPSGLFSKAMAIPERWAKARPLPADIAERLARVPEVCRRHGVRLCYLFGSLAAEARPRPPGDVDLGVLGGEQVDLWALRLDLGDALGTERLDVLDLGRASEVSRFEVLRTGRLLFKRDDATENAFELRTLAEYKDRAVPRRRRAQWRREALRR